MVSDWITVVCLVAYLPAALLLHILWYRWNPALKAGPAQGPAAKVVLAACLLVLTAVALLIPRDGEWLSHLLFTGLALMSLGTFYFTFLCVSESGRRYYLLRILNESKEGLSRSELHRLYGKDYMVDIRLARLLAWGVVEEVDGRLVMRKQFFYWSSMFFYCWATLLGYRWFPREN